MANLFGVEIATPEVNLSGILSNSWIYVLIIGFIGFILILIVGGLLFYRTYNRKVIVFENISGAGYQPVLKTRARVIRLGNSGEEILKTFYGGHFASAYGRKMGKNTYWFVNVDGLWYNIILGDIDTKSALLDIETVSPEVRMTRVAIDRLSHAKFDKKSFMEKYGNWIFVFILIALVGGVFWILSGKIAESNSNLGEACLNVVNYCKGSGATGIVPVK